MTHLDPKRLEAAAEDLWQAGHRLSYDADRPKPWCEEDEAIKRHFIAIASGAITAYLEAGDDWQPIETAPEGRVVWVAYQNTLGNWRTVRACYYPPETLDSESEESGWAPEGWYEEYEAYEHIYRTDEEPTHWQPLPQPPKKGEVS